MTYSDSTPGVTYAYDRLGRCSSIVQNGTTTTFRYNLAGQVLSESYSGGTLSGLSVTNGYDTLMRRTTLAALNSSSPFVLDAYGYDNASRLKYAQDGPNGAVYYYLANSPLVGEITFTNGGVTRMTTTKQYDFLNRLTQISSVPAAASPVTFNYEYNSANQRTRRVEGDGSYWRYGYDSLGQVISSKKYWSDQVPVAGQQFEYTFDDIGNRTQTKSGGDATGANERVANYYANTLNQYTNRDVPGYVDVMGLAYATNPVTVNGTTAYRHGEYFRQELAVNNTTTSVCQSITVHAPGQTDVTGNKYLPKTPELFSYDYDGNLTNDGRWAYTWDAENRLIKMAANTTNGPQQSLQFEYDAKGRRVHKQVWGNTNWFGIATNDLKFLYDGWNLVAELTSANSPVRRYLWGLDLSGSQQGAGGVGGLLETVYYATPSTNFAAFDGNGNVASLFNASDGSTAAQYEYEPFGTVIRATGPNANCNTLRFGTKYEDTEAELLYYGHRFLNKTLGRWLPRDSIEEAGGQNLYGFNHNSPITRIDSLGNWHTTVHNGLTWTFAYMSHNFNWTYADVIAFADDGVDSIFGWESSLPLIGQQDRHMFYLKNGKDSRDQWYDEEFQNAANSLVTADFSLNPGDCVHAAESFGKGLHSRQDKSAHRPWPSATHKEDWHPTTMHPAWWDAYDDGELSAWGLSENFWNEQGNVNLQTPGWGEDYIPWYSTAGQFRSQALARESVRLDTDSAVTMFEGEVRKSCFCRQIMLKTQ